MHEYYKEKGTMPQGKRKPGSSWQPKEKAQPVSKAKVELKPSPRVQPSDPVSGPSGGAPKYLSEEVDDQIAAFNDNQAERIYATMTRLFPSDNPFAGAGSSTDAQRIDYRKEIKLMAMRHQLHASMLSGFLFLSVGQTQEIQEAEARHADASTRPVAKKSAAKPVAKPEVRVKLEPKDEVKLEPKPVVKLEPKPDAKPDVVVIDKKVRGR